MCCNNHVALSPVSKDTPSPRKGRKMSTPTVSPIQGLVRSRTASFRELEKNSIPLSPDEPEPEWIKKLKQRKTQQYPKLPAFEGEE